MSVSGIFDLSTYTPEQKEQRSRALRSLSLLGALGAIYTACHFRSRPLRPIVLGGLSASLFWLSRHLVKVATDPPPPSPSANEKPSSNTQDRLPLPLDKDTISYIFHLVGYRSTCRCCQVSTTWQKWINTHFFPKFEAIQAKIQQGPLALDRDTRLDVRAFSLGGERVGYCCDGGLTRSAGQAGILSPTAPYAPCKLPPHCSIHQVVGPTPHLFACAQTDKVYVFDSQGNEIACLKLFPILCKTVRPCAVAYDERSKCVVIGTREGSCVVWNRRLETTRQVTVLEGEIGWICYDSTTEKIFYTMAGDLHSVDMVSEEARMITRLPNGCTECYLDQNNGWLIAPQVKGRIPSIGIWDTTTLARRAECNARLPELDALHYESEWNLLFAATRTGETSIIRVWDTKDAGLVTWFGTFTRDLLERHLIQNIAFDSKAKVVITASSSGALLFWSFPRGDKLRMVAPARWGLPSQQLAFDPETGWATHAAKGGSTLYITWVKYSL